MSIGAWIIDELEREEEGRADDRPQPELDISPPVEQRPSDVRPACTPERGVAVFDISPRSEHSIDL